MKPGAAGPPGEVRIIGGRWRRSLLKVPDLPGLRPTPARVRETVFNWLGQDLTGWRCLDAFAGTGALGLEAASRGAARVVLVERDPGLVKALQQLRARLEGAEAVVQVEQADGLAYLKRGAAAAFDLVFLDPPFKAGLHAASVAAAQRLLAPGGWIYLESGEAWAGETVEPQGLRVHRQGRAGAVHFHLLSSASD